MLPAARTTDFHVCPLHGGGTVTALGDGFVETNSLPQAHGGDRALCGAGPVDFVVTGSGTVTVHSKPAARLSDKTMHEGVVIIGSGNVLIGGPTVGATLGNPDAGTRACMAAAAGRTSGRTKQSYSNCGVETSRQIINQATGSNLGEDELLQRAVDNGWAAGSTAPDQIHKAGGSWPSQRQPMLEANGVPAEQVPGTMTNLIQAAAEGKGTEVDVWAGSLWPPEYGYKPGTGPHVVLVTGVEFDENGEPKNVIINDTGPGECGKAYSRATFDYALMDDNHLVTKSPIW
jgi:uncharacterized Zn-binding protein involved in type VI secretion